MLEKKIRVTWKEIRETDYKPDFEILDRYLNFSSEILRLSLLGISGFGVLLLLPYKESSFLYVLDIGKEYLFIAVIFLGLSSFFSLSHRYLASNCMSYLINFLRMEDGDKRDCEYADYIKQLKYSGKILILAELSFGLGILFFAIAIFFIFFNTN